MKVLQQSRFSRLLIALIGLSVLGALFWANLNFTQQNPGGNDFLPRWRATQLYLKEGQNPYSFETTLAIQQSMYGRSAWESEDQALFAYPFYTMFLIAPFAIIDDFALARAAWMTVLEMSLFIIAILGIRMANWRANKFSLAVFLLFAILWYHGAKPLVDGNISILIALFLSMTLWAFINRKDTWAGIFLALATIKPQMAIFILAFTIIWAISKQRWQLVKSFAVSIILLIGVSFILQPQWIFENLIQISEYPGYVPPGSPATIFSSWWPQGGSEWGWAMSGILFLLLMIEWWLAFGKSIQHYLWVGLLTLVLSPLIGIPSTTSNFISMLLVFPFIFEAWKHRSNRSNASLEIGILSVMFFGLWILYTSTLLSGVQYREHLIMYFPLPIFLLANLYWLRWWIMSPQNLTYPGKELQKEDRHP